MTAIWIVLAAVALGVVGWYAGRRRGLPATTVMITLLVGAAVAVLTVRGEWQQVVGAGMVGLVTGHVLGGGLRRDRAPAAGRASSG